MQLSLPPELEAQLRQRSEQVGQTPDQYLTTLLSEVLAVSPATPLSPHASTITLLQSWNEAAKKLSPEESAQAELAGNPSTPASAHASTLGFLGARAEAYLKMTPEELAAADQEFEQLKQNMNETRRLEGRPPAFY